MNTNHRKAVILDNLVPLHISFLIQSFDLKWAGKQRKEINLTKVNPVTGISEIQASIFIQVNIDSDNSDFTELQYIINGKPVKQRIELIIKKDNLRKGDMHYFRCPVTGKQRRKLFLYNGMFVSKQAIPNPHYISQTQSRKQRNAMKEMKKLIRLQKIVSTGKQKYFMKYYNSEPTRRFVRVLMASDDLNGLW